MKDLMKSKKMWSAFVVIFLSGIAIGLVGGMYFSTPKSLEKQEEQNPRSTSMKMHMLRRMSNELGLNEDQKVKVEKILGNMTQQINDIQSLQRPQIKNIIDSSFAEINKILTEDQKAKMAKILERMAQVRKKHQEMERREHERRKRGEYHGERGWKERGEGHWKREGELKKFRNNEHRGEMERRRQEEMKRRQHEEQEKRLPPEEEWKKHRREAQRPPEKRPAGHEPPPPPLEPENLTP